MQNIQKAQIKMSGKTRLPRSVGDNLKHYLVSFKTIKSKEDGFTDIWCKGDPTGDFIFVEKQSDGTWRDRSEEWEEWCSCVHQE